MKLAPAYRFNPLFAPALLTSRWPNWFDALFSGTAGESDPATQLPALNAFEDAERYTVHVELPGVKKDDVKIDLDGGSLRIQATRRFGENAGTAQYARHLSLPEDADTGAVAARLQDGVLALSIAKKAESKPRQITVQ